MNQLTVYGKFALARSRDINNKYCTVKCYRAKTVAHMHTKAIQGSSRQCWLEAWKKFLLLSFQASCEGVRSLKSPTCWLILWRITLSPSSDALLPGAGEMNQHRAAGSHGLHPP